MARPQSIIITRTLGLFLILILAAAACSRDETSSAQSRDTAESGSEVKHVLKTDPEIARKLMKGEWRLVAIDQRELRQGGTPTVFFGDEGNCWGNTGVNDFHTTFTLEGANRDRVKVGPAAVTRKAGPPEAMALETLFLERFESASAFKVEGDRLHLHSGNDQNLTFQRVLH